MTIENVKSLPIVEYPGSFARYDAATDTYYNEAGRELKHPNEYSVDNDNRYY